MCYVITELSWYEDEVGAEFPMAKNICFFYDKYTAQWLKSCLEEKYPHNEYEIANMPMSDIRREDVPYCDKVILKEGIT